MALAGTLSPSSFEEAASALAGAAAAGQTVRIRGAGTKSAWEAAAAQADLELSSRGLDRVLEHNAGDLTAILEAGVSVATAQETFAAEGQMLALDPALGRGRDRSATIGGLVATGDSGPLRHRYGAPRDLVVGMTVALSDGTIARSGGKVIKNVAGYDIAKLFCGAYGTLGMILSVSVRLHPLSSDSASALGAAADPAVLAAAARRLSAAPLELESLDLAWRAGRGGILARVAGAQATGRAQRIAELLRDAGLSQIDATTEDDALWARQRAGQRAINGGALVRVAARPTALADVLQATDACEGTLVGRAALGTSYVQLESAAVDGFLQALPRGAVAVVLDAPDELRADLDPWRTNESPALALMRRVKQRFDPARVCNPGVFVGGI
jgi:glycolate oxidase FAD binding subunit